MFFFVGDTQQLDTEMQHHQYLKMTFPFQCPFISGISEPPLMTPKGNGRAQVIWS